MLCRIVIFDYTRLLTMLIPPLPSRIEAGGSWITRQIGFVVSLGEDIDYEKLQRDIKNYNLNMGHFLLDEMNNLLNIFGALMLN